MAHDVKPREIYDALWSEAATALQRGQPDLDPHLRDRENDRRRGATLVFRPGASVRDKVAKFLHQAARIAPEQHIYKPDELHTTVLSVLPGSVEWQERGPQLEKMRTIIPEVLRRQKPFSVGYRGVTASTGAVMIQGFPADNTLAQVREELRAAFREHNIGADVDARYKVSAAHITAVRFSTAVADWKALLAFLEANRTIDFGETRVESMELIFGDWYASVESVQIIAAYPLQTEA